MARKGYKVRLPTRTAAGGRIKKHPLMRGVEAKLVEGYTLTAIAEDLNVSVQTLWSWCNFANKDRDFLLPAERVPSMSKLFDIPPTHFRPDLWPTEQWRFS